MSLQMRRKCLCLSKERKISNLQVVITFLIIRSGIGVSTHQRFQALIFKSFQNR